MHSSVLILMQVRGVMCVSESLSYWGGGWGEHVMYSAMLQCSLHAVHVHMAKKIKLRALHAVTSTSLSLLSLA